jgi:hypothetical protein
MHWRISDLGPLKFKTFFTEQTQAGACDGTVVTYAPVLLYLLQGLPNAQGRTIGPVRGHGFHNVGNGENAGLYGNFLPSENNSLDGFPI